MLGCFRRPTVPAFSRPASILPPPLSFLQPGYACQALGEVYVPFFLLVPLRSALPRAAPPPWTFLPPRGDFRFVFPQALPFFLVSPSSLAAGGTFFVFPRRHGGGFTSGAWAVGFIHTPF